MRLRLGMMGKGHLMSNTSLRILEGTSRCAAKGPRNGVRLFRVLSMASLMMAGSIGTVRAEGSSVTGITGPASIPAAIVGSFYSVTFTAQAPQNALLTWSIVSGSLPPGLNLDPVQGVVSGTPTTAGTAMFTISVFDRVPPAATESVSITVSPAAPVVTISPLAISGSGALGSFSPAQNIAGGFSVSGGVAPYTWSASGLPSGFSFNSSSGAFSGTAGSSGAYSFSIQVADAETPAQTTSISVSYTVLGITTPVLPQGSTTAPYSASLTASGGPGSYTFSASGLPQGVSLSPQGTFSGTPTSAGEYPVTLTVSSGGLSTSSTLTLIVTGSTKPLTASGGSLSAGAVSVAYSSTGLSASGGSPPYTWSVIGGSLPSGMSLSSSGVLSGTPSQSGNYGFQAQVIDAAGAIATGSFNLTVNPSAVALSVGTFPNGVVGVNYPAQILTTAANGGTAPYTFTETGNFPPGLTLANQEISGMPTTAGTFNFTIMATDANGKATNGPATIVVNPAGNTLVLSESSISFAITAGANGVPAPAQVTISSSNNMLILGYSVIVAPGQPKPSWLDVSGGTSTPGTLTIAVDPSAPALPASQTPYSATILVACPIISACPETEETITVTLTVSAPPPQLSLSDSILSFSAFSSNPVASSQVLGLQNAGGGVITINSISTGDSWLTVSGAATTIVAGPGASVTVTANPLGLSSGYYTSTVTVNSSAGVAEIPVTFLITPSVTMTLGPEGAQFSAPAGSSPGNLNGSFNVLVAGTGTVSWTASLLSGPNWLSLGAATGNSNATSSSSVTYSLNSTAITGLAPASYYATIDVSATGLPDQQYQVVLNITPSSAAVHPVLSPAGLVFQSGATQPRNVSVYSSSASDLNYQASATTTDGANWLSVSPTIGLASSGSPGMSTVSVNTTGLARGVYTGLVSYDLSSSEVRSVNVTLIVTAAGAAATVRAGRTEATPEAASASCTPSQLVGTQTGLNNNFAQPAGWPTPLTVNLMDDCGSPVNGASLSTTFSNGDPAMELSPLDKSSGMYLGTWTPRNPAPQVTVMATARFSPFPVAMSQVTGQVSPNAVPIVNPNAILDAFNPVVGAALAPGMTIEIYGNYLASQTVLASTSSLPTTLGGTSVLIGGTLAPLYFVSPGQINAQIPFTVALGSHQILVESGNQLSTPEPIQIVAAAPGIVNVAGQIVAQHAADGSYVTSTSPAQPGEYVVFYLSGLGVTSNPVASGTPTPNSPASVPLLTPTLTFAGATVPIAFVDLTPSEIGLFQISFQIPATAAAGSATISVTSGTSTSNQVVIPVQ